MKKRKKKTERQKVKDELKTLITNIVKKRDKNTCQWCGKKVEGSNCHPSHVIPVSTCGLFLRYDEQNIKILCFHCHRNRWHLNPTESGVWFRKKFPKRWRYLQKEMLNPSRSVKTWELEELRERLKSSTKKTSLSPSYLISLNKTT